MRANSKVLAMVIAGGEGSRLHPLTASRCKPALPFNGRHRIVDFVLSNLVNSRISTIYLLVQYKPRSLIEHVRQAWKAACGVPQHVIGILPAQMRDGSAGYQGTADAVYQNIHLIETMQPDVVAVFAADHIYRMDIRQMLEFHLQTHAHATVATLPVELQTSSRFGIVEIDGNHRIVRYEEKPATARPMTGSRTHALASMGNYLFETGALLQVLKRAHQSGHTDFGRNVLPAMVQTHKLAAYDFSANTIPGVVQAAREPPYWRDIGTIDAYYQAHFDTLCIVLERSRVGRGARVRRAIIDEDNHLPAGECIGFDPARDRLRFPVTESGIVVVPAGTFPAPAARRPTRSTVPPQSLPDGCVPFTHPGTACGSAMAASHAPSFT